MISEIAEPDANNNAVLELLWIDDCDAILCQTGRRAPIPLGAPLYVLIEMRGLTHSPRLMKRADFGKERPGVTRLVRQMMDFRSN